MYYGFRYLYNRRANIPTDILNRTKIAYPREIGCTSLVGRKVDVIGNAAKQLQNKGSSMHDIEILAGKFNSLNQNGIVLVMVIHAYDAGDNTQIPID